MQQWAIFQYLRDLSWCSKEPWADTPAPGFTASLLILISPLLLPSCGHSTECLVVPQSYKVRALSSGWHRWRFKHPHILGGSNIYVNVMPWYPDFRVLGYFQFGQQWKLVWYVWYQTILVRYVWYIPLGSDMSDMWWCLSNIIPFSSKYM